MAQGSAVARRWAQALFEAAEAAGAADQVGRDLATVVGVLWGDDKLREFFLGERVPAEAKKRLVARLGLNPGFHRLVGNFLCLAVDKRREARVKEVAQVYKALSDKAKGLVDVEVRTAVPLDDAGRENLENVLGRKLGARVRVTFSVDPALLGGLQVKMNDRLFDASLRRRLERLGEHLAKARVGV